MCRLHFLVGAVIAVVIIDVTTAGPPYVTTTPSDTCSAEQQSLACQLLYLHPNSVRLSTDHKSDNASAYNNVKDMCAGKQAASYDCQECPGDANGGKVCIRERVFKYILALANGGRVEVHELAGACHSCTPTHYQGLAVDLFNGPREQEYMDTCRNMGGTAQNEVEHIHCHFES
ncbi:hypothetical protein BsWGS_17443 [Bradybaena similaris]